MPALVRAAIAAKTERDSGFSVPAAQVLVTAGGKHAVYTAFQTIVADGDEVILPAPYWTTYPEAITLAGGVPVEVATTDAQGFRVTVEQLEAARTERTKAIVFVSPSNHRVHHGQNDYCLDRNYGGILIVWDRLFGTFVEERDDERIAYGVRKPLRSYNPVWGNVNVWTDLCRQAGRSLRQGRFAEAIGAFFAPPTGWGVEPEHLDTARVERYTTHTPVGVQRYAMALEIYSNL